jgi:two-component system, NarL family, uhpT operon response regulator UhpA
MITVGIIDDELFVQKSLEAYTRAVAGDTITVTRADRSVGELIAALPAPPHVVVLDVFLRDGTRLRDNIARLREWGCAVVVFSRNDTSPELRWQAKDAGALAFLHKDELEELPAAIESAAAGELYITPQLMRFLLMAKLGLTRRQEEVAGYLGAGLSNREIAGQMGISEDVVKEHVWRIKERYQKARRPVADRDDLRARLRDDGLFQGPPP